MQALVERSVADHRRVRVLDSRTLVIQAGDGMPSALSRLALHLQFQADGDRLVRRCWPGDPDALALVRGFCSDARPAAGLPD